MTHWIDDPYTIMSRIKAWPIPVGADVRTGLVVISGFYSNQVFLCMCQH